MDNKDQHRYTANVTSLKGDTDTPTNQTDNRVSDDDYLRKNNCVFLTL